MKPDKACMYQTITQYKIHILKTLSGNKANQVFKTSSTPCSYFLLQKNLQMVLFLFMMRKKIL